MKIQSKARKSERMSEILKESVALLLTLLSASAVIASSVRVKTANPVSYTGGKDTGITFSSPVKLSSDDIFNIGSFSDLCEIHGIGEVLATRIITEREDNGFFIYPEDILSVNGIGTKKLEQYRSIMKTSDQESGE